MRHLAEPPHKPPIVRGQSKEAAYIVYALRFGPFDNRFNLPRRSFNSIWADFKAEIIDLSLQELALVKSPVQFCFPELLQSPPKVPPMLVNISTENEDVV